MVPPENPHASPAVVSALSLMFLTSRDRAFETRDCGVDTGARFVLGGEMTYFPSPSVRTDMIGGRRDLIQRDTSLSSLVTQYFGTLTATRETDGPVNSAVDAYILAFVDLLTKSGADDLLSGESLDIERIMALTESNPELVSQIEDLVRTHLQGADVRSVV